MIIFDLDDTLIDTTGSITPVKLEHALLKMVEAGLAVGNFQEALDILRRMDPASESAAQTLQEFLEVIEGEKKYFEIGHAAVYSDLPEDIVVYPVHQAREVLEELQRDHMLALVSMGAEHQQHFKMKKAGIDSTIFSKIIISAERDKKPHYKTILDELGFTSLQTVVCGDRVKRDLSPAKELGCTTIHMQWGRGANGERSPDVDFAVRNLSQIKDILSTL